MKKEKPIIILERVIKPLSYTKERSKFQIFLTQLDRWLEIHLYGGDDGKD